MPVIQLAFFVVLEGCWPVGFLHVGEAGLLSLSAEVPDSLAVSLSRELIAGYCWPALAVEVADILRPDDEECASCSCCAPLRNEER